MISALFLEFLIDVKILCETSFKLKDGEKFGSFSNS